MLLTLIRHGESVANADGLIAGSAFAPLSERGRGQARSISTFLESGSYDVLISSDRPRAIETARPISQNLRLDLHTSELLRERDWGKLAEARREEYELQLKESGVPFFEFLPPGGETFCSVEQRARTFLMKLLVQHPRKAVILVAHESINKALLKVMLGFGWEDWPNVSQRNGCINVIGLDSNCRGIATQLDSIDHLPVSIALSMNHISIERADARLRRPF